MKRGRTEATVTADAHCFHAALLNVRTVGTTDPLGDVLRQFLTDDPAQVILTEQTHNLLALLTIQRHACYRCGSLSFGSRVMHRPFFRNRP